jgi:hypothetical protein
MSPHARAGDKKDNHASDDKSNLWPAFFSRFIPAIDFDRVAV